MTLTFFSRLGKIFCGMFHGGMPKGEKSARQLIERKKNPFSCKIVH